MSVRHLVVLALVVLAGAPLCVVLFADGREATAARPAPARARVAQTASISQGCVERPLAYGLTNDEAQGERYDRDFLSPLVSHPPLPRPGFYAPGHSPDQAALFHALYHGYVVVRYRRSLAGFVRRRLSAAVRLAAEPTVVVAGSGMPFAAGALVYGRTSICGRVDRTTIGQLADWIASARAQPPQ